MPPKMTRIEDVHRGLVLEQRRIDIADETRGQHAAETATRRAHGEGHDLVLERVDADGLGRHFVLANRHPRSTDPSSVRAT
jgi:hypothetical protein